MSPFEEQRAMLVNAINLCESHVESMLLVALFAQSLPDGSYAFGLRGSVRRWELATQHAVGKYRVDIAVLNAATKLAIEVDGHDWHERTREQACSEKARERALQDAGWLVRRYAGTEVWRDSIRCAKSILDGLDTLAAARAAEASVEPSDPLLDAARAADMAGDVDEQNRALNAAMVRSRSGREQRKVCARQTAQAPVAATPLDYQIGANMVLDALNRVLEEGLDISVIALEKR